MQFETFDLSEYTRVLEDFVAGSAEDIVRYGGDLESYHKLIETLKTDGPRRDELAKIAIAQYGDLDKYTQAMKYNMAHFSDLMEELQAKQGGVADEIAANNARMERLLADLDRDVSSPEVLALIGEMVEAGSGYLSTVDMGEHYWERMADGYLTNQAIIEVIDRKYGAGASHFLGRALKAYWKLP